MPELPKLETYFYFSVWISGVSISLYRLFLVGQIFDHRHHDQYHYEDFRKGWKFLGGRFQDQADSEWNIWTQLFLKLIPFLLLNFLGAELIRFKKIFHLLPFWYVSITVCMLIFFFNLSLMFWFLFQTLIYFVIIHLKSHLLIWCISFVTIQFFKPEIWFVENEENQYLVMVCSSWMILRCISYSVDKISELDLKKNSGCLQISDALTLLAYSFYLPTMFCGPFISYSHFNQGINQKKNEWSCERVVKVCKNFFKCLFWFLFTVFSLHFIYVNAILLRPDFVMYLLDWELAGLGIAMGHFFHLKYIVFYGIPCAWADAEGFETPKLPCCVSRVHLYSYMWRHFDHGLYQFLIRYIYVPITSKIRGVNIFKKTIASIVCFTFIFVWHGEQDYVFFWVLCNYIAVTIELMSKQISNMPSVRDFMNRNLSSQNQRRLGCCFAAPLHCFSMVSNYFFIGNGVDIGFIYLNRVLYGSLKCKLTILFFLYGAGQTAVTTQNWEIMNKQNKKKLDK